MQMQGKACRISIYTGEGSHYQGKPLYMAVLELLKREGASGATVTRGLAGFGAHSLIHSAAIMTLSTDLPITLTWVDVEERVNRLLPQIRHMVDDGLITREDLDVVQYAPGRWPNPLDQPVHNIMRTEVLTVQPDTSINEVVALLLDRGYRSLPVIETDGSLTGIITDGDLLRRINLSARLGLQTYLTPAQLQQQLSARLKQTERAADIMTRVVITVRATDTVRVAAQRMAEYGLKRLPVIDELGHLVGLVSRINIFQAVEYHQNNREGTPDLFHAGASVAELMYKDVPTVSPQAQLEEIVQALETTQRRRAIVIDDERHVLGIITDGDLLRRSRHAQHPDLLSRLRTLITGQKKAGDVLPPSNETAAELMTTPLISIQTDIPLIEALRLMVQHGIKRLPVVDQDDRLVGLLGRASLLHGLLANDDSPKTGQ